MQFAVCEFRQFVIVTFGKVLANLAQLLFDDVIVVDEPLCGW